MNCNVDPLNLCIASLALLAMFISGMIIGVLLWRMLA